VYRNDGSVQQTQSVSVYRNGKMYPDGRPPDNMIRPNGSGQGIRQDYKPEKLEPPSTRAGATAEVSVRIGKEIDVSYVDIAFHILKGIAGF
jgi:hypothetical protein